MEIAIQPLDPTQVKPALTENFGFGQNFSNRMFSEWYSPEKGWHDAVIGPYQKFELDPATAMLHYGQGIFEGMKAYRRSDGNINLFRPWENMKRFNRSATRLAMPSVDEEAHLGAIIQLVEMEHEWVPAAPDTALYIRPVMFGADSALGVHASKRYLHYVIVGPVGAYFAEGFNPVPVYISHEYRRAVRGGVGAAKTAGNYAASLFVGAEAKKLGYSQVLWLDAIHGRYIEEVGAMNICFVYEGNHIKTPPLTGSILPGVTRDSVIKLGRDLGYTVTEEEIDVNDMLADVKAGKVTELFGCGTAAVIAPVGRFGYQGDDYLVNNGEAGPVARRLYKELTDIQWGRIPDRFNWTHTIKVA